MNFSEFAETLQQHGAIVAQDPADSERHCVVHFGNPAEELTAVDGGTAVAPLPLIRILATGKDRAKFLHNFCTNNIRDLQPGHSCEAFFTDVKARVLAHGYVLAFDLHHEVWLLPGEEQRLVDHLNRYIITEDVTIQSVSDHITFAMMGASARQVAAQAGIRIPDHDQPCAAADTATALAVTFHRVPIVLASVPSDNALGQWQRFVSAGAVASGQAVFEHLRILEGFPRVGVEITNEHLAPEANRNSTAVSYTKGCYLGQEPIARLDAMGHVNRQLFTGTADPIEASRIATDNAPVVSSASEVVTSRIPVLMMYNVRAATASPVFTAWLSNGAAVEVTLNTKP